MDDEPDEFTPVDWAKTKKPETPHMKRLKDEIERREANGTLACPRPPRLSHKRTIMKKRYGREA